MVKVGLEIRVNIRTEPPIVNREACTGDSSTLADPISRDSVHRPEIVGNIGKHPQG